MKKYIAVAEVAIRNGNRGVLLIGITEKDRLIFSSKKNEYRIGGVYDITENKPNNYSIKVTKENPAELVGDELERWNETIEVESKRGRELLLESELKKTAQRAVVAGNKKYTRIDHITREEILKDRDLQNYVKSYAFLHF